MYRPTVKTRCLLSAAVLWLAAAAPLQAQQPPSPPANPLDAVPDKMPADIPYGTPITLERAEAAIAAAVAEAKKRDWKLNVAMLDSGANLVAFARMDGAQLGSIEISQAKARAAVSLRRETKALEGAIQSGNTYLLSLPGIVASRGGIPVVEGGKLIGAIGCSGGTGSQDEIACKAGVAALQAK